MVHLIDKDALVAEIEKLKGKDLMKKLKPFEDDEIVMVASKGEVSFYDKEGMFNIIHLSELENEEHCFVTRSED